MDDVVHQCQALLARETDPDRVLFRSGGVEVSPRRLIEILMRGDQTARVYATILWRLASSRVE